MELTGKVSKVLEMKSGQSRNGKEWRNQDFVVEFMDGEYSKSVCFTVKGDSLDHIPDEGDEVKVSFTPESREYNGRWYTSLTAWKIEQLNQRLNSNKTEPKDSSQLPF